MWVVVRGNKADPPCRIDEFKENRCHNNVLDILKNYRGGLHSVKYAAYQKLLNKRSLNGFLQRCRVRALSHFQR